jgi:sodium pump decarboxylase gamma subunit
LRTKILENSVFTPLFIKEVFKDMTDFTNSILYTLSVTSEAVTETAEKAEPVMSSAYVTAVVLTGLCVVFLGLILLIILMSLMGLGFKQKKAPQPKPEPKAAETKSAPVVKAEEVAPVVSAPTDDFAVIAAITAAIAYMSEADGVNYQITSVTPAQPAIAVRTRNPWAMAGVYQNTQPF